MAAKIWAAIQWAVVLSGSAIAVGIPSAIAQEAMEAAPQAEVGGVEPQATLPQPPEMMPPDAAIDPLEPTATTVTEWVAQIEASLVQITAVRVEAIESGLQVVLETAGGDLAVPETRSIGNALIADIPNATIADEFFQAEPIAGIALVEVTGLPGDRVRVAITGTDAPPVAEVRSDGEGLVFGVVAGTVAADEEEAIEIVVTGDEDEGYNPSSATTATRTDTPLRDIPQSITVVPRQVLEDRNVRTVTEAIETVSGVVDNFSLFNSPAGNRLIRGFNQQTLRNGLRDDAGAATSPFAAVEQVEVLRGPSSVLFGALEPGGVINVITRQPLDESYYSLGFEAGNFGLYQLDIDLSGPLTENEAVLYRFIAAYQGGGSFQERSYPEITTIAPSTTLRIGDRTNLNLFYEYGRYFADPATFDVPLLSDGSLPPTNLSPVYLASVDFVAHRFGYSLNHEFNDNWQIRNNLLINLSSSLRGETYYSGLSDDRILTDYRFFGGDYRDDSYFGQIDLVGRFRTGSISHQIVAGFDINRYISNVASFDEATNLPNLDISDPNYDVRLPEFPENIALSFQQINQSYGIYLQDQIAFSDDLKLLLGGRYDWVSTETGIPGDGIRNSLQSDGAFSPRIGLVYQPSQNISLYTSYSQSFRPTTGRNPNNEAFVPTRGTQYEVGVRAEFLDGRLSANLAAYNLTRSNVLTPDPDPELARQGFQIQAGEQRSRGVELDIGGEISPGWNIIASYAYTDAVVSEDNAIPEGNRLTNVPENQASLWTTYTIQEGDLEGLGFGLGLFYIGERQGDLANSFQLNDYLRTDAALYYRRGRFNAAINVRNLFDIDYVSAANFGRLYVQRAAPFTIIGSISWEF